MKISRTLTIFAATVAVLAATATSCNCSSKKNQESTGKVTAAASACITIQRGVLGQVYDTILSPGTPNSTSGGTAPTLFSGGASPGPHIALVSFDLSAIPAGKRITSAAFQIYVSAPTAGDVTVHRATSQWTETSTYAGFANAYEATPAFGFTASGYSTRQFDLLTLVNAWYTGQQPNYGIVFKQGESARTGYRSSETTTIANRPSLTVCFEDAPLDADAGTTTDATPDVVDVPDAIADIVVAPDVQTPDVVVPPVDAAVVDAQPDVTQPPSTGILVGAEGIVNWDALTQQERDAVKSTKVFFGHMSVGACIAGEWCYNQSNGTAQLGYPFRNVSSASGYASTNFGDMYLGNNHYPDMKLNTFRSALITSNIASVVSVAGLKFCYVDFTPDSDLVAVQSQYASVMSEIKAAYPSVKLFHVTPPLTTVPDPNDGWRLPSNQKRAAFGTWMKSTFASEAVLDLQDIENTRADGTKCTVMNTPALCPEWALDEGHPNSAGSARIAKAFLYTVHKMTH